MAAPAEAPKWEGGVVLYAGGTDFSKVGGPQGGRGPGGGRPAVAICARGTALPGASPSRGAPHRVARAQLGRSSGKGKQTDADKQVRRRARFRARARAARRAPGRTARLDAPRAWTRRARAAGPAPRPRRRPPRTSIAAPRPVPQAELQRQQKYPNLATPHRLKGLDVGRRAGARRCAALGCAAGLRCRAALPGCAALREPAGGRAPAAGAATALAFPFAPAQRLTTPPHPHPAPTPRTSASRSSRAAPPQPTASSATSPARCLRGAATRCGAAWGDAWAAGAAGGRS
jgi:hypothetical protein